MNRISSERRKLGWALLAVLVLICSACGTGVKREAVGIRSYGAQEAQVEEISFRSGSFRLVGDLRLPAGEGPHPAVVMLHGDGAANRDGAVPFEPMIEIFLRNDYAVFSWDKPGTGESKGEFNRDGYWDVLTRRAEILVDGIDVLVEHPEIDADRIGLWGISQAGWVMPKALELSSHIAFMIVASGGAEASPDQMAYLIGQKLDCGGGTSDQAALVEEYWAQAFNATSYAEYREAVEILLEIPHFNLHTGTNLELAAEEGWQPEPRDRDRFFDPMDVIEHTTIPMLVFFGELDKNIDPVQGVEAYEAALQAAGNQNYHVELIPDVGHVLMPARTGCIGEASGRSYAQQYLEVLEAWLQELSS
jgi:pimeloyl-ACP methyl ester carboxylesterase